MALQSSGQITLSDIATEFGDTAPHALSEFYGSGGAPASGQISISDFYGLSAAPALLTTVTRFAGTQNVQRLVPHNMHTGSGDIWLGSCQSDCGQAGYVEASLWNPDGTLGNGLRFSGINTTAGTSYVKVQDTGSYLYAFVQDVNLAAAWLIQINRTTYAKNWERKLTGVNWQFGFGGRLMAQLSNGNFIMSGFADASGIYQAFWQFSSNGTLVNSGLDAFMSNDRPMNNGSSQNTWFFFDSEHTSKLGYASYFNMKADIGNITSYSKTWQTANPSGDGVHLALACGTYSGSNTYVAIGHAYAIGNEAHIFEVNASTNAITGKKKIVFPTSMEFGDGEDLNFAQAVNTGDETAIFIHVDISGKGYMIEVDLSTWNVINSQALSFSGMDLRQIDIDSIGMALTALDGQTYIHININQNNTAADGVFRPRFATLYFVSSTTTLSTAYGTVTVTPTAVTTSSPTRTMSFSVNANNQFAGSTSSTPTTSSTSNITVTTTTSPVFTQNVYSI